MAFDPFASPESVLERGKSLVKSVGDTAVKQIKTTNKVVKQQASGSGDKQQGQTSDQQAQEFVQDLYAPSKQQGTQQQTPQTIKLANVKQQLGLEKNDAKKASSVSEQLGFEPDISKKTASFEQQIGLSSMDIPKTPEEVAKMNKAASELQQMHDTTYFKPTFVEKPKIEEQEKEQEKKQEEKQEQKRQQLEEQKKKEVPIALQQARNKIEMNRGASG